MAKKCTTTNECPYAEDIRYIRDKVDKMTDALCGDQFIPEGLIKSHQMLSRKVDNQNKKFWIGTGIIMAFGALVKFLK
jgi:hypothetical protein